MEMVRHQAAERYLCFYLDFYIGVSDLPEGFLSRVAPGTRSISVWGTSFVSMYLYLCQLLSIVAFVHFSNETVSQTTVSSGPMKMFPLEHETVRVCQNKHCTFCSRGVQV